jgi:hypothetical protein
MRKKASKISWQVRPWLVEADAVLGQSTTVNDGLIHMLFFDRSKVILGYLGNTFNGLTIGQIALYTLSDACAEICSDQKESRSLRNHRSLLLFNGKTDRLENFVETCSCLDMQHHHVQP